MYVYVYMFTALESPSPACMASVSDHIVPNAASMPRYGGRPVSALNSGTLSNPVAIVDESKLC